MAAKKTNSFLLLLCLVFLGYAHAEILAKMEENFFDNSYKKFELFHSIGKSEEFARAGEVKYNNLVLNIPPKNIDWNVDLKSFIGGSEPSLSQKDKYKIKLVTDTVTLVSSIPACLIEASRWNIVLQINLDSNGDPWNIGILVPANSCDDPLSARGPKVPKKKLKIELIRNKYPPRPILRQQTETAKEQPQKSSVNKYWVYIMLCIAVMFGNLLATPQQNAQTAGAQSVETTSN